MFKSLYGYIDEGHLEKNKRKAQAQADYELAGANVEYANNNFLIANVSYCSIKGYIDADTAVFSREVKAKVCYRLAICLKECYSGSNEMGWTSQEILHNFKMAIDFGKNDYYANFCVANILYHRKEYAEALKFAVTAQTKNKFIPDTYLLIINIRLAMGFPTVAKNNLFDLIELLGNTRLNYATDENFLRFCEDNVDMLNQIFDLYCKIPGAHDHPDINRKLNILLTYHLENLIDAEDFHCALKVFDILENKPETEEFLRDANLLYQLSSLVAMNGRYAQALKLAFFTKAINIKVAMTVIRFCNNSMDEIGEDFDRVMFNAIKHDGFKIETAPDFYAALENFLDSNRVCLRALLELKVKNREYHDSLMPPDRHSPPVYPFESTIKGKEPIEYGPKEPKPATRI